MSSIASSSIVNDKLILYDTLGNKYIITTYIGGGQFGSIYLSCKYKSYDGLDSCNYVAKFIKIDKLNTYNPRTPEEQLHRFTQNTTYIQKILDIKKEIEIQKLAASINIAPNIVAEFVHDKHYIFIMENLSDKYISFDKFKKQNKDNPDIGNVKRDIVEKIDILNLYGIQHNDLHSGNIYIKENYKEPRKIMIIDYGMAEMVNPKELSLSKESERFLNNEFEESNTSSSTSMELD